MFSFNIHLKNPSFSCNRNVRPNMPGTTAPTTRGQPGAWVDRIELL